MPINLYLNDEEFFSLQKQWDESLIVTLLIGIMGSVCMHAGARAGKKKMAISWSGMSSAFLYGRIKQEYSLH